MALLPSRDLCESPPTCHSEGAERPKNLITMGTCKILRGARDDNMAFRRGLKSSLKDMVLPGHTCGGTLD